MLQNASICTIQKKISGSMPPNPPSKRIATPRVASPPPKKRVGPPWQILHAPMNYYWEIYLGIHPGRQLIVCSTLYVYALQNLFRGQKMTKIVAQHILKCITWALFSNTMVTWVGYPQSIVNGCALQENGAD